MRRHTRPTGAVRIRAKNVSIKCVFLYPLPDSSLRVRLCSFSCHHSDSVHRSRMTAGVLFVLPWRSDLCTQTCPYRLAKLGTSLRVRGKLTLRKKAIKFYKSINWSNEYTKNRIGNASRFCMFYIKGKRAKYKPPPLDGEGGSVSRHIKNIFYDGWKRFTGQV